MSKWKQQFNLGNVIALSGLLFTMGFFNHVNNGIGGYIVHATLSSSKWQHVVDSIVDARVDSVLASGASQNLLQGILDDLHGEDREQIIESLKQNNSWASDIRDAMGDISPQQIAENHRKIANMQRPEGFSVGPFVDAQGFKYRWYNGEVFPVRWGRPYEGLKNDVPFFYGPDHKVYTIPSLINNL